jgi:hypothetical protein
MKKFTLILCTLLTMMGVFSACTDIETPMTEQNEAKVTTIMATIESYMSSRVALTDDEANRILKVDWKTGDAFKINVNGTDYTFTYTESNAFECTDPNFPTNFTSAALVTAIYPATLPTAYAEQAGTLEGAAELITMTATLEVEARQSTSNLELKFKHNTAVVKLNLSNEDFAGKSVTSIGLKAGGTPVVTASEALTGDADGSVTAYLVIPSASFAMTGITIHATCNGNSYSASLSDKTLQAGKLYNVNKQMTAAPTDDSACITFGCVGDQQLGLQMHPNARTALSGKLEYSVGGGKWSPIESGDFDTYNTFWISFGGSLGDLRLRGKSSLGTAISATEITRICFGEKHDVTCTGDIRTLIDWENYEKVSTSDARFRALFNGCDILISAPDLPATELASYCYFGMFSGCSNLVDGPDELPATHLPESCYAFMFSGCYKLEEVPEMPTTTQVTVEKECCSFMFYKCKSIVTGPSVLPATTLAIGCYQNMFHGCVNLTTAPALPATTLADFCYSTMFCNCTLLDNIPSVLPATTLAKSCYDNMFNDCKSITTSPVLPATTLAKNCYERMFEGCSNLNKITMLADALHYSDIPTNALNYWVNGVAQSGMFIKSPVAEAYINDISGIPTGWTIQNYVNN